MTVVITGVGRTEDLVVLRFVFPLIYLLFDVTHVFCGSLAGRSMSKGLGRSPPIAVCIFEWLNGELLKAVGPISKARIARHGSTLSD